MKKRFVVGFNSPCKVAVMAESAEQAKRLVIEKSIDGDLYNVEYGEPQALFILEEQSSEAAQEQQKEADDFKRRMDKGFALQRALGLWTVWSMYEVIDKMDEVPFPGATELHYDVGWGKATQCPIPPDATWTDLWKVASWLMKESGDTHHQFIESMERRDDSVYIYTGS